VGVKNRLPSCSCPLLDDGRPARKGDNPDDEDHYDPKPTELPLPRPAAFSSGS
jgi:hypothetical protein